GGRPVRGTARRTGRRRAPQPGGVAGRGARDIQPEGVHLRAVRARVVQPRPVSFRPNAVAVFLRPNGAGVNSQRCQPLEPDPTNHQSPKGATVPKQEPASPQAFAGLYGHVLLSTKHRLPALTADLQLRLYEYVGGILRNQKSALLAAGGMPDHVHLLVSLGRELAVAELIRLIKSNSTKWIHETFPERQKFAWQ